MTKVIAPSSADVSLRPGEVLTVTMVNGGAGYTHPLPLRPATSIRNLSAGANTFGPFMTDEKIRIYCSAGYLDYSYSVQSETNDVGSQTNPNTWMVEILNPETGIALYAASVSSGTPVSIAGDGASKDFAAYTIPAGSVKPNQHARITALFKKTGAAGGNFAGVYIGGQLLLQAFPGGTTMRYALEIDVFVNSTATGLTIMNVNASQITTSGPLQTTTTESATSVAIDFSADQVFAIKGYAQAGEVQTLLGFSMEWTR